MNKVWLGIREGIDEGEHQVCVTNMGLGYNYSSKAIIYKF